MRNFQGIFINRQKIKERAISKQVVHKTHKNSWETYVPSLERDVTRSPNPPPHTHTQKT
jgi:hypothetical protein